MSGCKEKNGLKTNSSSQNQKPGKTGLYKIPEKSMKIIQFPYTEHLIITGLAQHELKHN